MSIERRRGMVDRTHSELSIRRQCQILSMRRSSYYYKPVGESPCNLELMKKIDELFLDMPLLWFQADTDFTARSGLWSGPQKGSAVDA